MNAGFAGEDVRPDAKELQFRYMNESRAGLCGDTPVLGRMKELLSYWCQKPAWRSRWRFVKICRSTEELSMAVG